jgi:hypothetical protein
MRRADTGLTGSPRPPIASRSFAPAISTGYWIPWIGNFSFIRTFIHSVYSLILSTRCSTRCLSRPLPTRKSERPRPGNPARPGNPGIPAHASYVIDPPSLTSSIHVTDLPPNDLPLENPTRPIKIQGRGSIPR